LIAEWIAIPSETMAAKTSTHPSARLPDRKQTGVAMAIIRAMLDHLAGPGGTNEYAATVRAMAMTHAVMSFSFVDKRRIAAAQNEPTPESWHFGLRGHATPESSHRQGSHLTKVVISLREMNPSR
jgi:hypothetical protein